MNKLKTEGTKRDAIIYGTGLKYKGVHIPILELKSDYSNLGKLYNKYKQLGE